MLALSSHYSSYQQGAQFSTENFAKFCRPVHKIPWLTMAKLSKFSGILWPSVCMEAKLYSVKKLFGDWYGAHLC